MSSALPSVGSIIGGFAVTRVTPGVRELDSDLVELLHLRTGLRALKMVPRDPGYTEATFAIAFSTPPTNDGGLPHICEHSVLCGSDKFPLKEPFSNLLQGSLQVFLNAFTYGEHTVYPFASRCKQDFENIMDIYLDAAFFPLMLKDRRIYEQEGHRLHVGEKPEQGAELGKEKACDVSEQGVVLNEMRGEYSDPSRLAGLLGQRALFPDGTLRFESGGEPSAIVKYRYEDLVAFHAKHYHPANAFVAINSLYPLEEELALLEEKIAAFATPEKLGAAVHSSAQPLLTKLSALPQDQRGPVLAELDAVYAPLRTPMTMQPRLQAPRETIFADFSVASGTEELDAAGQLYRFLYLFDVPSASSTLRLAHVLLDYVLFDTPSSPVPNYLQRLRICETLESMFSAEEGQAYTRLSATGCGHTPEKHAQFARELDKVFSYLISGETAEGFDFSRYLSDAYLLSALNKIEFRLREVQNNNGLSNILDVFGGWLYGLPPEQNTLYEDALAELRTMGAQGRLGEYMRGLLREYYAQNAHRVDVVLSPKPGLSEGRAEAEKRETLERFASLPFEERLALWEEDQSVMSRQKTPDSPEALATFPSLKLEHLEGLHLENLALRTHMAALDVPVVVHNTGSAGEGVVYARVLVDITDIATPRMLNLLGTLAGNIIGSVATTKYPTVEALQEAIDGCMGSFDVTVGGTRTRCSSGGFKPRVFVSVRFKALRAKLEEACALVTEILTGSGVGLRDAKRVTQLVRELKTSMHDDLLNDSAYEVAMSRARVAAGDELQAALQESSGMALYKFLRGMDSAGDVGKGGEGDEDGDGDGENAENGDKEEGDAAEPGESGEAAPWAEGLAAEMAEALGAILNRPERTTTVLGTHFPELDKYTLQKELSSEERAEIATSLAKNPAVLTMAACERAITGSGPILATANAWAHCPADLPRELSEASRLPQASASIAAPINVNYVAKAGFTEDAERGSLYLATAILSRSYLWDTVRVLGGAYGCFIRVHATGEVSVVSYRDPNLEKTVAAYDEIPAHLRQLELPPEDLLKFKIGAMGGRQCPIVPKTRFSSAYSLWLDGRTAEGYSRAVGDIIHCSADGVRAEASAFESLPKAASVVFGKAESVKAASQEGLVGALEEFK